MGWLGRRWRSTGTSLGRRAGEPSREDLGVDMEDRADRTDERGRPLGFTEVPGRAR
jgi:hypothetical protein